MEMEQDVLAMTQDCELFVTTIADVKDLEMKLQAHTVELEDQNQRLISALRDATHMHSCNGPDVGGGTQLMPALDPAIFQSARNYADRLTEADTLTIQTAASLLNRQARSPPPELFKVFAMPPAGVAAAAADVRSSLLGPAEPPYPARVPQGLTVIPARPSRATTTPPLQPPMPRFATALAPAPQYSMQEGPDSVWVSVESDLQDSHHY
jgi:hypothetical protein